MKTSQKRPLASCGLVVLCLVAVFGCAPHRQDANSQAKGSDEPVAQEAAPFPTPAVQAQDDSAAKTNAAALPSSAGFDLAATTVAANAGDVKAQIALADYYARGQNGSINWPEALKWYRAAGEQGDARAQFNLAVIYTGGFGVARNYPEAAKWYERAAKQGDSVAQYDLGTIYATGRGVPFDPDKASIWYQKAAQQGDAMAQIALLQMAAANAGKAAPRPEEMMALYLKAAAQGYAEAQTALGHIYAEGLGVARDPIEARKWYSQAAERGEADALHWVGTSYLNGDTAPRTVGENIAATALAFDAFSKSASAGYPQAQFSLGMMRLTGEAGEANPQEAFGLIQKAAEQNLPTAQTQLASMYEVGQGTTQDFAQAYQWYVKAAALGDQEAARSIDRVARHLPQ